MVENPEGVEQVLLLKVCKDLKKDRVEITWRNRIEERADVIIARDGLDAKKALSVIVSLTLVELPLVLQKRRGLHEKDAKGA
jgi:hypothetical protein